MSQREARTQHHAGLDVPQCSERQNDEATGDLLPNQYTRTGRVHHNEARFEERKEMLPYDHRNWKGIEVGGIIIGYKALAERIGEIESKDNPEMIDRNTLCLVMAIADLAEEVYMLRINDHEKWPAKPGRCATK